MHIIISNQNEVPIYQQLKNQIKDAILSGELADGDMLPSIRNMANETRASVLTVRRAYDELEAEGLVHSVHGKGCFVAARNIELIKEAKLKDIEKKLLEAYDIGRQIGVTWEDMWKMMEILFEDAGGE